MALPATDSFHKTTAGDVDLATYSANWSLAYGGTDQTKVVGSSGDYFYSASASDCVHYWNADAFADNQYAQIKIVNIHIGHASSVSATVRVSATGFYILIADGAGIYLYKHLTTGDAWTLLGSTSSVIVTTNDILRLEASGTTLTPKLNGSVITSIGAKTDSDLTSGSAGIHTDGESNPSGAQATAWEGGNLGASGTLSQALAALTDSATGTLPIVGAAAQTLAAVTSVAGGIGPISGVVSQNLAALTPTAAGKVIVVGTEAQSLAALTVIAAGSGLAVLNGVLHSYLDDPTIFAEAFAPATGTLTKALAALVGANAGTVVIAGAEASTLAALVDSGAGQIPVGGASAAVLTALTVLATGTGAPASNGVVSAVLSAAAISSGGTLVIAGQESTALDALTRLLYGTLIVDGTEASNLAALVSSAAGTLPIVGASTPALASLAISATGVPGEYTGGAAAINLAALAINAAGFLRVGGDLSQALAVLAISATGTRGAVPFLNVGVPVRASSRSTLVSSRRQTVVPTKKG